MGNFQNTYRNWRNKFPNTNPKISHSVFAVQNPIYYPKQNIYTPLEDRDIILVDLGYLTTLIVKILTQNKFSAS